MAMDQPTILLVGVCACAPFWHGKLTGKKFTVTSMTNYHYFCMHMMEDISAPRTFEIQEILIPEKSHHEPLKKARCHFFIDTHKTEGSSRTHIARADTPPERIYYQVIIGQCYIVGYNTIEQYNIAGFYDAQSRVYARKKVPKPGEIIKGIAGLIMNMQESALDYWLSVMQSAQENTRRE